LALAGMHMKAMVQNGGGGVKILALST